MCDPLASIATSAGTPATVTSCVIRPSRSDQSSKYRIGFALLPYQQVFSIAAQQALRNRRCRFAEQHGGGRRRCAKRFTVSTATVIRNSAFALSPRTRSLAGTGMARAACAYVRSQMRALSLCMALAIAYRPSGLSQRSSDSFSMGSGMSRPRSKFSTTTWEFRLRFQAIQVSGYAAGFVTNTQAPGAIHRLPDKRRELLLVEPYFFVGRRCGRGKNQVRGTS